MLSVKNTADRVPAANTAGLLGESFPNEVLDGIWDFVPIRSLIDYGNTSNVNRARVQHHFSRIIFNEVKRFCKEPNEFLELVWETGSVLSGSIALAVMEPRRLRTWIPSDMDVYTTSHNKAQLIAYLSQDGYKETSNTPSTSSFYANHVLRQVIELVNAKGMKIEIMVVEKKSPVTAVLSFYGSHVMNFLTGRGLWSAYPKHTLAKRSLYNTTITPYLLRLPFAIQRCLVKYSIRGYAFNINAVQYLSDRHECGISYSCPHTKRALADRGCLVVNSHRTDKIFTHNSAEYVVRPGHTNEWKLAGDPCHLEEHIFHMAGFVSETDSQTEFI